MQQDRTCHCCYWSLAARRSSEEAWLWRHWLPRKHVAAAVAAAVVVTEGSWAMVAVVAVVAVVAAAVEVRAPPPPRNDMPIPPGNHRAHVSNAPHPCSWEHSTGR